MRLLPHKRKLPFAISCLTVAIALTAFAPMHADVIGFGSGGAIPDNNPSGFSSSITFTQNEIITGMSISIDFGAIVAGTSGHTYVGDLIGTLSGPGGSIVLFDRPGFPATAFGDSSNLANVYIWANGGADFSAAAANVGNNAIVANGTYSAQAGDNSFRSFATTFNGSSTAGLWTLNISDNAGSDTGGIVGWTLNIQGFVAIPEPSSPVFLAAAFAVAGWWSYRKREREKSRRRDRIYY